MEIAGDRVGRAAPASRATLAGANVDVRTVTVRPAVTLRIEPLDLNVVLQRSATHQFDLVVATNVFVYYDVLEQVLALERPRDAQAGWAAAFEQRAARTAGSRYAVDRHVTTEYSEVRDDGDHIVFYQAQ